MRKLAALLIISLIAPFLASPGLSRAQEPLDDPLTAQVEALIEKMSAEQKVGQLFLVTFRGTQVDLESDIADLIINYKVGGVVLSTTNGNILNFGDTPGAVVSMTNQLQALAQPLAVPREGLEPNTLTPMPSSPFIPLFIAVEQEGDNYPYTKLINGFTAIPNNMAIGATWNIEHARTVGQIVGRELAAVGVNMLLGPSLDVLDKPRPAGRGDLGTRTFGGDPFWVGEMGKAYIAGIHDGSRQNTDDPEEHGRVAVVAKHLPGHGGSDRRADQEIPSVRGSLEDLKQFELPPFFAVAQPDDSHAQTDALMTAHVRYLGLQGNIRDNTNPLSFDRQAMSKVMEEPPLKAWREEGGVIVSDALGVRSIQTLFEPQLQGFNGRRIANIAFDAGNDLLYLSEYGLYGVATPEDELANIKDTILHFRTRYEEDQLVRERIDASVRRILRLKLQLYPEFSPETVQVDPTVINEIVGKGRDQVFQIAQNAITLIAPGDANFVVDRPASDDQIVIFTDDRQLPDSCPAPICQPDADYILSTALADIILRLYGPGGGTEEIRPENVKSFTFSELLDYLSPSQPSPTPNILEGTPTPTPIPPSLAGPALEQADWIVFAMLDVKFDASTPSASNAVRLFLEQANDLIASKRLVVLAYNSPYYLDATEITKLDAYYGIYSRVEPFIEASVRTLFGELGAAGASPVSIDGTNYNLLDWTSPDPSQTISLNIIAKNGITITQALDGTPESPPDQPALQGDVLMLRTGVILDHNGHVVPDDTLVEFISTYLQEEGGVPRVIKARTKGGVAQIDYTLERAEIQEISVRSGDANTSSTIRLNPGEPPQLTNPTPSPTPTATPTSTPTPTATPTSTPTPTPTFTPTPIPTLAPTPTPTPVPTPTPRVNGGDLILAVASMLLISSVGFISGRNETGSTVVGMRLALWIWVLGLVGYILYGLGVLDTLKIRERLGAWGASLTSMASGLLPMVIYAIVAQILRLLRHKRAA